MFEGLFKFIKKFSKENKEATDSKHSKETAKERLHLVLMQDRANVSADFLEMMKQEIIEVIKKYIDVDENQIDVKLTNKLNSDGTNGAPALYANIPIVSIKDETRKVAVNKPKEEQESEEKEEIKNEQEEEMKEAQEIIEQIIKEESSNNQGENFGTNNQ